MLKNLLALLSILFLVSCSTIKKESNTISRSTATNSTSLNFSFCDQFILISGNLIDEGQIPPPKIEHLSSGSNLVSRNLQCPYILVENWRGKDVELFYNLVRDTGKQCDYSRATTSGARSNSTDITTLQCYPKK